MPLPDPHHVLSFTSIYLVNLVWHTKKLTLALFATLVHASLLSIKHDAVQELKFVLAVN